MNNTSEIIEIKSFDGYTFKGKLTLPEGAQSVPKLVVFVNGSGANTYDNRRPGFVYFDFFANEFTKRDAAFFSYSTRGCDIGEEPPMFVDINEEEYKKYLPLNTVEDVYHMIAALKQNERLKDCKVYLLGASEGTIVAPLVAEKYPDMVDGLLLTGYANLNMKDILIWQNTGGPSMVWYRAHFETDEQGRVSKKAYQADPNDVISTRLQNLTFENIDFNNDGYISEEDFAPHGKQMFGYTLDELTSAIERQDDEWLRGNYGGGKIPLTSGWFLQHFDLRSNMEVLPALDLPIHIFHGVLDQNVDVREVYKIHETFQALGKTNLTINVFEKHNHDLNYQDIITKDKIPAGIQAILDAVNNI